MLMDYPYAATVDRLTQICAREALAGLNLADSPLRGLFNRLLRSPLRRFAAALADADRQVIDGYLDGFARALLPRLATTWRIAGVEHVPPEGPLLVVANHPGGLEILAVLAHLHRPDVYMVSNDQPLLRALPNADPHMIYLGADSAARAVNIRQVIARLREGAAVLIFPAGWMEPDPAVTPGALKFIEHWSDSPGLLLSRAPQTRLLPAAVSGVIGARAMRSWIVRRRKTLKGRQRAAAFLQMVMRAPNMGRAGFKGRWPIHLRLVFGAPVAAQQLAPALEPRALAEGVRQQMRALLQTLDPLPDTGEEFALDGPFN